MEVVFGNGLPLASLLADAQALDEAGFANKHGAAFLLFEEEERPASTSEQRTTGSVRLGARGRPALVFPVIRKRESTFDFISVGRHENNDIYLPSPSVSRFHAYLRQHGSEHTVQDASSRTGTTLDGVPVPRQGDGAPVSLRPGAELTFGDVRATFVDAALFLELARTVLR